MSNSSVCQGVGHVHREAALFIDCEPLYKEKVHTTNDLSRSGRQCVYPTPYWGQEVKATIIYLYRLYIILGVIFTFFGVPAQLVFFNPITNRVHDTYCPHQDNFSEQQHSRRCRF